MWEVTDVSPEEIVMGQKLITDVLAKFKLAKYREAHI